MIGEKIEYVIEKTIENLLDVSTTVDLPNDIIETDNIGEVIEKLAILHCRMWHLEDLVAEATTNEEIGVLKRKIDICFKQKRPKYVEAINRMIENSVINGKSLIEDSVKHYKEYDGQK